jgi:HAD superfamily hydrolase (TIGR01509 family)
MTRRSAVIFDLDGTLTVPYLDFDAIRAEIGIASGPILEALTAMDATTRRQAEGIVRRHEEEAAIHSVLQDGAAEVVAACRRRGHPVAILTRNARVFVDRVLGDHGILVDAIRTRNDGAIKPSPLPVLSICLELEADPRRSWVVGDYLFDIQSGRDAGTKTVLMIGTGEPPAFAGEADYVIRKLPDLLSILESDQVVRHT